MVVTGVPFFIGCVVFNFFPGTMAAVGPIVIKALVDAGALLQVNTRAEARGGAPKP